MIRNLVLALLALNLLYLVWAQWLDHEDQARAVPASQPHLVAVTVGASPCATVGPFTEPLLALQAQEKLKAGGFTVQSRESTEALREGWWVHVDNADQDQQSRTFEALRRAGITDVFAIPDDPKFRVSVGVFAIEARAEDRAAQVQRLRLDAVVSERLRDQAAVWLDVTGIAREALRDGRLAAAGVALDGLRVESCPTPAAASPAAAVTDIIPAP